VSILKSERAVTMSTGSRPWAAGQDSSPLIPGMWTSVRRASRSLSAGSGGRRQRCLTLLLYHGGGLRRCQGRNRSASPSPGRRCP